MAPENCIAIEDSLHGTIAAVDAGMICFTVPQGKFDLKKFQSVTPHVFKSLKAIHQFLVEQNVLQS
jgi:beta-phosphoglucomutase-like phosphatase (HAD superfamily)